MTVLVEMLNWKDDIACGLVVAPISFALTARRPLLIWSRPFQGRDDVSHAPSRISDVTIAPGREQVCEVFDIKSLLVFCRWPLPRFLVARGRLKTLPQPNANRYDEWTMRFSSIVVVVPFPWSSLLIIAVVTFMAMTMIIIIIIIINVKWCREHNQTSIQVSLGSSSVVLNNTAQLKRL